MLRKPPKATASSPNPMSATGQPSANSPAGPSVKPRMNANRYHPCAEVDPMRASPSFRLHGLRATLARSNPDHVFDRHDEDLAVTDSSGAGAVDDRLDRVGHLF